MALAPRVVTLVLTTPGGALLGALDPFEVPEPWWQEVRVVVEGAREHARVDVTVLRLLSAPPGSQVDGGPVSYLAEVAEDAVPGLAGRLRPWPGPDPLVEHPLRPGYARPGGPAADLAWADEALAARGAARTSATQRRTWNLSSIWSLDTTAGPAWLKVVPPFFAHEGAVLARLDADHPGLVPPLLAAEGPRVLLADVPGEDHYHAPLPVLLRLVEILVGLQVEWAGRTADLLALGAPDWRAGRFAAAARDVVDRTAGELDGVTVAALRTLLADLPERFAALDGCRLPDTLVHGDFHPGNAHGDGDHLVLLDWGDCGVGNPLLDQAAFTERLDDQARAHVVAEWSRLWRLAVPGCDPDRAAGLLQPVAALRQAVIYRAFLDAIEPDERAYHVDDPARWLRRAALLVTDVTAAS